MELPPPPEAGRTAVEVRGLTVVLGGTAVLSDVDVDIRHGELLALVGPNGAGKSTLLGAVAGDVPLNAGSVAIDGRPLADWGTRELAFRRSVLLQRVDISFPFTVGAVVRMGRSPWAGTDAEDEDDGRWLQPWRRPTSLTWRRGSTPPCRAANGPARRLLGCLPRDAGVLLLDEPTAALDLHHQELVMQVARDRAGSGRGSRCRCSRPGHGRRLGGPGRDPRRRPCGRRRAAR